MKNSRIIIVAIYSIIYLATSLFLESTVLMQTVYNLCVIALVGVIIYDYDPPHKAWAFLKNICVFFWIGQTGLYLYNLRYVNELVEVWFYHFNAYEILIPVYLVSLIIGILWKK